MAELADALDLGSSGRPWGFKSLIAHQIKKRCLAASLFVLCTIRRDLNPRGRDRKRECHTNIRAGHGLKATVYGMFQNQQFFFIFGTLLDVSLGFYVIKSLNCNYFFKKMCQPDIIYTYSSILSKKYLILFQNSW